MSDVLLLAPKGRTQTPFKVLDKFYFRHCVFSSWMRQWHDTLFVFPMLHIQTVVLCFVGKKGDVFVYVFLVSVFSLEHN